MQVTTEKNSSKSRTVSSRERFLFPLSFSPSLFFPLERLRKKNPGIRVLHLPPPSLLLSEEGGSEREGKEKAEVDL
jgi:hypothetical protein